MVYCVCGCAVGAPTSPRMQRLFCFLNGRDFCDERESIMNKDYMCSGPLSCGAAWITVTEPDVVKNRVWYSAWDNPLGREGMFKPIEDREGMAHFRKQFAVHSLKAACIDVTALGVFELWCNGKRVGRREAGEVVYDEMKPGWTDYNRRVLYYSYDLLPYLKEGVNTLVAAVSGGWHHGRISYQAYGKDAHAALLAAIHISDADGETTLATDHAWDVAWGGAVRAADIWDGEVYDANLPSSADLSTGLVSLAWEPAITETHDHIAVTPYVGPTVMARSGIARTPASIVIYEGTEDNGTDYGRIHVVRKHVGNGAFSLKAGEAAVVDLGQNMVGRPNLTVRGGKGTTVLVRFGEMLNDSGSAARGNDNPEGSIYSVNYRSAKAKLYYTLRGDEAGETYTPLFTFFGFRYLEITATADVEFLSLDCPVIGSATPEIGYIETSHPDVNRLIQNVLWGQRSNYLSVPTDCPQRDERLGWTGDTQAFCGTAAYNADVSGFFRKWLQDVRDAQCEEGMYPDVIPSIPCVGVGGAAWSDAGIIVPYTMWRMYGDTDMVEEHYASMERYMDWLATTGLRGPVPTYGDWLAYEPTDSTYISTAYYALDAQYMAAMSRAIGRADRAEHYTEVYETVRAHFRDTYCDEAGNLLPAYRTQCGYLLALRSDLLVQARRADAVAALKAKIVENGYKLSTGFVGSCILCEVLGECGENHLAYSLLLQTQDPSWLYSVHQGATTIWERWNSYTKAKGFGDVGMNSFNHYAYGAVMEWMYRHVAGIETTEAAPGFAAPILQPKPDTRREEEIPAGQEKITWAKASYVSRAGLIESAWDLRDGFAYTCTVPVTSTLYLPILTESGVYTVNGKEKPIAGETVTTCGKTMVLTLPAGHYEFHQA